MEDGELAAEEVERELVPPMPATCPAYDHVCFLAYVFHQFANPVFPKRVCRKAAWQDEKPIVTCSFGTQRECKSMGKAPTPLQLRRNACCLGAESVTKMRIVHFHLLKPLSQILVVRLINDNHLVLTSVL